MMSQVSQRDGDDPIARHAEGVRVHCRCGAVELTVSGAPVAQLYCHCDDCRAASGGAYVASAIYPAASVTVSGGLLSPLVIRTTQRMRCVECGTHLFSELTGVGMRSVNAFLLPDRHFKPQLHVQCAHAVLPIVDDLPHYAGFPPAYGGSDARVEW